MRSTTRRRNLLLAGVVGLPAALALACATQPAGAPQQAQLARAVAAPDRRDPPEPMSGTARAVLKTRMGSHTRDMSDLVSAIMVLEYDRIHERAASIASDASLARPLTHDATELNSGLSEQFFVFQDELRARAGALARAADEQNPFHVADAYGRLSETCVKCHATYRAGR